MSAEIAPLPPGTPLRVVQREPRYVIQRSIHRGGFGVVYEAFDHELQIPVAIKELAPEGFIVRPAGDTVVSPARGYAASVDIMREAFVNEAQKVAGLSDRHVVRVYGAWQENGTSYFAMDLVRGGRPIDAGPDGRPALMPGRRALSWMLQVLEGLHAAHKRGVGHFDIKPSNVLVDDEGQAIIIDFGGALHQAELDASDEFSAFTPGFAPIELERRDLLKYAGPWSDLYSWAMLLVHLVVGHPTPDGWPLTPTQRFELAAEPYRSVDALLIASGVPRAWATVVQECLSLNPAQRPQSVPDLLARVRQKGAVLAGSVTGLAAAEPMQRRPGKAGTPSGTWPEVDVPTIEQLIQPAPAPVQPVGIDSVGPGRRRGTVSMSSSPDRSATPPEPASTMGAALLVVFAIITILAILALGLGLRGLS